MDANTVRSRRTHHKSRFGCRNCKRRRIKCDETKPACSNCLNHAVPCDFSAPPAPPSPATSDLERPTGNPKRNYRFKPSQYQTRLNTNSNETTTSSTGTQCNFPASAESLSLPDLQLFHHFVTSTHCTLTEDAKGHELWQIHVPQWGITFSSILHLILALSALHCAHQQPETQPELRDGFVAQADQHFAFGVSSVTGVLSQFELTPENTQPIYIATILICFIYFARGPRSGEYLVFSDTGQAEWLVLLRGVQLVVQTHRADIFTGALKPHNTDEEQMHRRYINPEWQETWREDHHHLQQAQQLIRQGSADAAQGDMYVSLLETLMQTFEEVYVKMSFQLERVGLMQYIVGWLYRLPEEYIEMLKLKEPCALVILAYWSILLQYMRSIWFMRGWDIHVIDGIAHTLPWDRKGWISWPMRRIQSIELPK